MRVLGLVDYSEKEAREFARPFLLGLLGVPLGALIAIHLGLLRKEVPKDPVGLLIASTPFFAVIYGVWWLTTIILTLIMSYRKKECTLKELGRIIFFLTVMIPLGMVYILPLMAFIFNPLFDFLLQYYSPYGTFWIGAGVFLPFALLYIYIILPDLRPRMRRNLRMVFTRSFWRNAWRKPKSRREIKIMVLLLVIIVVLHVWDALT